MVKGKNTLIWTKDPFADGYIVKQQVGAKFVELVRVENICFTTIVMPDLKRGAEHYFRVSFYKRKGNTYCIYRNEDHDFYMSQKGIIEYKYSRPKLKKAERIGTSIAIEWEKILDEVTYVIARKSPGGIWKRIGMTKENYYIDSNIDMGQKYIYTVRCVSDDGKINLSSCYYKGISIEEW